MAKDLKPKAEATIRAEIRRLRECWREAVRRDIPSYEDRANMAIQALEWARGGDAAPPSSTFWTP